MLAFTLGIASVVLFCIHVYLWHRRFTEKVPGRKPLPPGSMGWPFVGETIEFLVKGISFFVERFEKYGKIYKTHFMGSPTIRVAGSEMIHDLLRREPKDISVKWMPSIRKILGAHGLPIVKGEEHRFVKKVIQQVFLPKHLSDYLPCIQEHVRNSFMSWSQQGQILGFPACENLVTDVMTEVFLGCRKNNERDRIVREAASTMNRNLMSLPIEFPGGGLKKAMDARRKICDFIKERLEGKRDTEYVSMVDILLFHQDTSDRMTDEQLMDNMVSLMIAGTGSTSGALCLCLMHLGKHPEVVEKIREELDQYGLLDKDQTLNYDILQKLEYVHNVEKEVLRITPPVGGTHRKTNVDIETENYLIPKDWTVIYSIRDTHQIAEGFPDRDKFKPDRWNDKTLENKSRGEDSCNYIPFGAGNRMCVGRHFVQMLMHVFIIESVRLMTWELHNPNPEIGFIPVTMPKDRLPVTFKERT